MPLPLGGTESYRWCVGCDCLIDDLELYRSGLPVYDRCSLHIALDKIAEQKGYKLIEAGTFEAFKLRRNKHVSPAFAINLPTDKPAK